MNHITDNIVYQKISDFHFIVIDLTNCVSVTTTYPVDAIDPEDLDRVNRFLSLCRELFFRKKSPRYNIVIDLGVKGTRYYVGNITGYSSDPLPYYFAWDANEVPELKNICQHLFLNAWEEEVKPFQN